MMGCSLSKQAGGPLVQLAAMEIKLWSFGNLRGSAPVAVLPRVGGAVGSTRFARQSKIRSANDRG